MSDITESRVLEALKNVMDPDLHRDIVTLGFVQDLEIDGGTVRFRLVLTTPACPMKDKMKSEAEKNLMALDGVEKVEITLDAKTRPSRAMDEASPDINHILLVASGKGGVGKSTVAVNLAAALKETGATVGIMDADIYGPSIPPMLGIKGSPAFKDEKLVPIEAHGMPVISIGFLVKDEDAVIWRGPLLHKMLTTFVQDVVWGTLDYLIIDLPPGTGDVQISLSQLVKASAALLVSTPQDIAFRDVRRAGMMFGKVDIPVIGMVENMSYFVCPHCNERTEIFPRKDGDKLRQLAPGFFVETLAEIPLEPAVAESSENGVPLVLSMPESDTAKQFRDLAGRIAQKLSVMSHGVEDTVPVAGDPTDQD